MEAFVEIGLIKLEEDFQGRLRSGKDGRMLPPRFHLLPSAKLGHGRNSAGMVSRAAVRGKS